MVTFNDSRPACLALMLCAAAMLAGCQPPAAQQTSYDIAPSDAMARLQQADIARFKAAESFGMPIDISAAPDGSDTMRWQVSSGLFNVASFSVRLDPNGSGAITPNILVPSDPAGGEIYDGDKHYDHPALRQPLRPAIQELVDAALTQRSFDPAKFASAQQTPGDCGAPAHGANAPAGAPGSITRIPAAPASAGPAPEATPDADANGNNPPVAAPTPGQLSN